MKDKQIQGLYIHPSYSMSIQNNLLSFFNYSSKCLLVGLLLLVWIVCPLFYLAAKTNKFTAHLQHHFTSNIALTKPFSHSPLSTAKAKTFQIPPRSLQIFLDFFPRLASLLFMLHFTSSQISHPQF